MRKIKYTIYTIVDRQQELIDFLATNGIVIDDWKVTLNRFFIVNALIDNNDLVMINLSDYKAYRYYYVQLPERSNE